MTIPLGYWLLPAVVTLAAIAAAAWLSPRQSEDDLRVLAGLGWLIWFLRAALVWCAATIAILASWLLYFAWIKGIT